jgi:hypothetical protein
MAEKRFLDFAEDEISTNPGSRKRRKKKQMDELKKVKFTVPHWLTLGFTVFAGAVIANLRSDPFTMFSNASGVKAAIAGAVIAGVMSIAALVQSSIVPGVNVRAAMIHTAKISGAVISGTLLVCLVWACSGAQQSQEVTLGVDTLVCVLNHDTDPPPTIALECGISDLTKIATILNAHKAAMIRDLALDGGVTK